MIKIALLLTSHSNLSLKNYKFIIEDKIFSIFIHILFFKYKKINKSHYI